MHILFLSDNFFPESNALANRLYDHARIWVKLGHKVTVLTCAPNFPRGQIFSGYRNNWRKVEILDGIRVVRIKSYITENQGFLKRIVDYMSFALHSAVQGLFIKKPDIVFASSPQPFPVFSAWLITRLKRRPFIFELRDLWPESIVTVGAMNENSFMLRSFNWLINRMYHAADMIVSVTDSFKQKLIEEGIAEEKIIVAKNGISPDQLIVSTPAIAMRRLYKLENKYLVGYVGTIGMSHSIETVVRAAKNNMNDFVHFIIMGSGAMSTQIEQDVASLDNVTFINGGSREDAINVTNMLDASIVHLKNTSLFKTVIPSKIFEAMALGKPILMGVKGESRKIVIDEAKAGLSFEPEDHDDLNDAIARLQQEVYDCNQLKSFVEKNFNRDIIADEMIKNIQLYLRTGHK